MSFFNPTPSRNRARFVLTIACVAFAAMCSSASAQNATKKTFDVPAQSAEAALKAFADQSGQGLIMNANTVAGIHTNAVKGEFTPTEALSMMLEGTGLVAIRDERSGSFVVHREDESPNARRAAQMVTTSDRPAETTKAIGNETISLDAYTVTGSHIRGSSPASPIIEITSDEIARSGFNNVGDVIRSLPQNFSGGSNPQLVIGNAPTSGNTNYSGGSSPNLRGLGPGSTLTLINGHRLGQDGLVGAVDISLIPVDIIDHIEVVTDSGSSAYGSDAVAGVVNFILKKNYKGAQTSAMVGGTSDGGGSETQVSQLLGTTWKKGGVVLAYEHDQQGAIDASQRDFTSSNPTPFSLLPQSIRDSVFISANAEVGPGISAHLDGLDTWRTSQSWTSYPAIYGLPLSQAVESVTQYEVDGGVSKRIGDAWKAEISMDGAGERNTYKNYRGGLISSRTLYYGKTSSGNFTADGPIVSLPAGVARAAIGGEYRHNSFDYLVQIPLRAPLVDSRDVKAVFGELNIPIFSGTGPYAVGRCDIDVSGRYEEYNDVGRKAVPKLGFTAVLADGIRLSGSWSEAFRAPTLTDLHFPVTVYQIRIPDPMSGSGSTLVLYPNGGNVALKPETATSTVISVDFTPKAVAGLRVKASAYDIKYSNRLAGLSNPTIALTDPTNAGLVTRNPSAALQQSLIAGAAGGLVNQAGVPYNPSAIGALVNGTKVNLFSQEVYGVDFLAQYERSVEFGTAEAFLNLAYAEFRQRNTPNAPEVELAGRAYYPPSLRGRGGITLQSGNWTTTIAVNWLNSSINTFVPVPASVSSWTTMDAQIAYALKGKGLLSNIRISLSIQNLLDRNPPFVQGTSSVLAGLNYDSVNATPLGRYASLKVTKSW